MQTKLRKVIWLIVVSLLWTSPMSAATIKAAAVKVKTSTSRTTPKPQYEGVASWYGANRQGRKMANGQKFDRRALTAACWYFPLGTMLHVINLSNGNGVTVTVTDRGPNLRLHRVVDLSEAAADQLGYIDRGVTRVVVTPIVLARPERAAVNAHVVEPIWEKSLLTAAVPISATPN